MSKISSLCFFPLVCVFSVSAFKAQWRSGVRTPHHSNCRVSSTSSQACVLRFFFFFRPFFFRRLSQFHLTLASLAMQFLCLPASVFLLLSSYPFICSLRVFSSFLLFPLHFSSLCSFLFTIDSSRSLSFLWKKKSSLFSESSVRLPPCLLIHIFVRKSFFFCFSKKQKIQILKRQGSISQSPDPIESTYKSREYTHI